MAPDIPTGVIYIQHGDLPFLLRKGQGRFITKSSILKPHCSGITKRMMLFNGKLFGYAVLPWTVNTRQEARRLFSLGAAGVISDCPEVLI